MKCNFTSRCGTSSAFLLSDMITCNKILYKVSIMLASILKAQLDLAEEERRERAKGKLSKINSKQ